MRRPKPKPYRGGLSKQARREWRNALDKHVLLWGMHNALLRNARAGGRLAVGVDMAGQRGDLSAVHVLCWEPAVDGEAALRVLAEWIDWQRKEGR